MSLKDLPKNWKRDLLKLVHRETQQEALKYCELVDQALGHVDYEVAKVLMSTFTAEEDYEVQESVVRVLSASDLGVFHRALLEELPRLVAERTEWAMDLVGLQLLEKTDAFMSASTKASEVEKQALKVVLSNKDLRDDFPVADDLLRKL